MKRGILFFFMLAGFAFGSFSQQLIITDASGGIFSTDQSPVFEIESSGWLKLAVNGNEIYRGKGPAFPELGSPPGEERTFLLEAEYYSELDELLESFSWFIHIDKRKPALPVAEFRNTKEGLAFIQAGGKSGAVLRAWADLNGEMVFFQDLGRTGANPHVSFSAIVWAEDLAGNFSKPSPEYFEISLVRIENPAPGEWLNTQMLVITGGEGQNIYWTAEDTNQPGPERWHLYEGPVRIAREGNVSLRVTWQNSSGLIMEDRVNYTVVPEGGDENSAKPWLDHIQAAEETAHSASITLPVPGNWHWSIGGIQNPLGGDIVLRPEAGIRRAAVVQLANPAENDREYRFAYFLDGGNIALNQTGNQGIIQNAALPELVEIRNLSSINSQLDYLEYSEPENEYPPLTLFSSGKSRLVQWPEIEGRIYFSWGGAWFRGNVPLPIPLEGVNLRWVVFNGEKHSGPFTAEIEALPEERQLLRGRIAFRNYSRNENNLWNYASDILVYRPGIIANRNIDVSNGEDLEWAFISSGGKILERRRRNRLPPPAPVLLGIPESGWTRGPINIETAATEDGTRGFISARLAFSSGREELLRGNNSLKIISGEEIAKVTVEAFLVDPFGNRGPSAEKHFTLDPRTIYVSSLPFASYDASKGSEGGMDNPFKSLEEALDYAEKNNLTDIRAAGVFEIQRPARINRNMHIDGNWMETVTDSDNRAVIIAGRDFSWNTGSSANLKLKGIRFERSAGNNPLFNINKGSFELYDSVIKLSSAGDSRIPAISVREGSVEIVNSHIEYTGNYPLLFDVRNGNINANSSVFTANGNAAASIFSLYSSKGNFSDLTIAAQAEDYASVLEAQISAVFFSRVNMAASAKDANAVLLEQSPAVIADSQVEVNGEFSVRAVDIRGSSPFIQDSRFISRGSAERSEVFSLVDRAAGLSPDAGGNRFFGFTHFSPGRPFE